MGWGLTVNGVYVPRVTSDGIDGRMDENSHTIKSGRDKLLVMLAQGPEKKFYPGSGILDDMPEEMPLSDRLPGELDEILDEMLAAHYENVVLGVAKENPKQTEEDL